MTLQFDAKALLAALKKATAAVEPYKRYDVLQCVRIEADAGRCKLTSFNLEHEIIISMPVEGVASPFLVNVGVLIGWLSKVVSRGTVSVEAGGNASVWSAGNATATLPSPDIGSWSSFGPTDAEESCICSGKALAEAISAALVAVQEDPARPYLSGVRLEVGSVANPSDAGRLVAIGTNGVMLMARDIAATGLGKPGSGIILTIETVKALSKLLDGVETVTLAWNARRVAVDLGDVQFQASLIEARFPENWRGAAGTSSPHVTYDSADLVSALSVVTALAGEEGERRFRGVALSIGTDETILRCNGAVAGAAGMDKCRHSLIETPPRANLSLAANQLLKLVGALDGETVQISIGANDQSPCVLSVAAKADRIGLSVPLRGGAAA